MIPLIKKLIIAFIILVGINIGFIWYGQANFKATVKSLGKAFVENNVTFLPANQKLPALIERHVKQSNLSQNSYKALVFQLNGEYSPKPSKLMKMHTLMLLRPTPDMLLGVKLDSNPIVTFNAINSYSDAQANMQMMLFGIISTGELSGKEFARSELARLLAYSVFNPALLKSGYVRYEAIDSTRTKATIVDGKIEASVIFIGDKSGKIVEVQSGDRLRTVNKEFQKTNWRMRILSYGNVDGLNLPKDIEEMWVQDKGDIVYSKYSVTSAKRL